MVDSAFLRALAAAVEPHRPLHRRQTTAVDCRWQTAFMIRDVAKFSNVVPQQTAAASTPLLTSLDATGVCVEIKVASDVSSRYRVHY